MSKFDYKRYKEIVEKYTPKQYKAKLTDDLEVVATIHHDGEVHLDVAYKENTHTITFNDKDANYYRYWSCKTKTARMYSLELYDECETDH